MKIESGMRAMKDHKPVEGKTVSFFAPDDREMFEVRIGSDGCSLEIRGIGDCKVGKVRYSASLTVEPNVSNVITVRCKPQVC